MKVISRDSGHSWSLPVSLPDHVLSARPQMLMMSPKGPLLLTGGRPHLMLWVSHDGTGNDWDPINLAQEHNRRQKDPSLKFCEAFANGTSTWLESTCYNSIQRIADSPNGQPTALVCYDRMGTEPPAAPKECQPSMVSTFCMKVSVIPHQARVAPPSRHGARGQRPHSAIQGQEHASTNSISVET